MKPNKTIFLQFSLLFSLSLGLLGCNSQGSDISFKDSNLSSTSGSTPTPVPPTPTPVVPTPTPVVPTPTPVVPPANWQLDSSMWVPSKIDMMILQPGATIDSASRFQRAYPGLEYKIQPAVRGGAFPYYYELTQGPQDMTINSLTGEIFWPNPQAGTQVTLKVTDQELTVKTVSWPIKVTTDGFIFVDANTSSAGNGKINSPYKTMKDWYKVDKYNKDHSGDFVYYRNGVYKTIDVTTPKESKARIPCLGNNKPVVHMAYPGEQPIISVRNKVWAFYGSNNQYMQGLTFKDLGIGEVTGEYPKYQALYLESRGQYVTLYGNTFESFLLPNESRNLQGTNSASIFVSHTSKGRYWAFLNNNFNNARVQPITIYELEDGLIANNVVSDFSSAMHAAFYVKIGNTDLTIRQNTGLVNMGAPLVGIDGYTSAGLQTRFEVCYNNANTGSNDPIIIGQNGSGPGQVWSYRNTWKGSYYKLKNLTGNSALTIDNDIMVHSGDESDGVNKQNSPSIDLKIFDSKISTESIIDNQGDFNSGYDQYRGIYGHHLGY